jgi:superfamily II DNA/RNA helicase
MEKLFKGNGSGMLIVWCHARLQYTNTPTDINLDGDHTYMMFSATFPKEARRMAKEYMETDCIKIKVNTSGSFLTSLTDIIIGWPRWQHSLEHYAADRLRQREREEPGSGRPHLL